ncbi:hypothetical protein MESS2_1710011 [Mesorhizobium metallidurans STM 2683]|uniref:Uncharacterized protein n=1 Tax=Mesorhizobium metallidurans STM 2683 TaxID=1297569 RepID=M5EMD4_9HYPH|nr:hypothetical protein MESS2_1710011 [Mesorhizobium metallidurans STM 2683]
MTLAITLPSFFCTWNGRNWAGHKALAIDILCMAVVSPLIRVRMNDAICAPKENPFRSRRSIGPAVSDDRH